MEHTSAPAQWQRSVPPCPGEQPNHSQKLHVSLTWRGLLSEKQIHNPSEARSALCLKEEIKILVIFFKFIGSNNCKFSQLFKLRHGENHMYEMKSHPY